MSSLPTAPTLPAPPASRSALVKRFGAPGDLGLTVAVAVAMAVSYLLHLLAVHSSLGSASPPRWSMPSGAHCFSGGSVSGQEAVSSAAVRWEQKPRALGQGTA